MEQQDWNVEETMALTPQTITDMMGTLQDINQKLDALVNKKPEKSINDTSEMTDVSRDFFSADDEQFGELTADETQQFFNQLSTTEESQHLPQDQQFSKETNYVLNETDLSRPAVASGNELVNVPFDPSPETSRLLPQQEVDSILTLISHLEDRINSIHNHLSVYDQVVHDLPVLKKNAECMQTIQRKFNLLLHNVPLPEGRRYESKELLLDTIAFMFSRYLRFELSYKDVADVARLKGNGRPETVVLCLKDIFQKIQIMDAWKRNRLRCEKIFDITEHYSNVNLRQRK